MLKSITVNYDARDFFGNYVMRSETQEKPSGKDVDKALGAVKKGNVFVHFTYHDGQSDCLYADLKDKEDGTWTLCHSRAWNSRDTPVRIAPREARRRVRTAIKEA